MEIQIITKKVQGWLHPFAIFRGTRANWHLQVKIKNFTGQEKINYTWALSYGQNYPSVTVGSTRELKIQPEQTLKWSFVPYQSGEQRLELLIVGLDPNRDKVLDDYGTELAFYRSDISDLRAQTVRYNWVFEVEKFREIFLFWFAIVATVGAIFEILNFYFK